MNDPILEAFKSLHLGNLLAARDAHIEQLEEQLKSELRNCYTTIRVKDEEKDRLETVNAALRAEVESLAALSRRMDETINVSQAECRRLKAEVEALMTTPTSRLLRASQAENISLRKAGDAMASNVVYIADVDIPMETLRQFSAGWNAAKEGIETA